MVQKFVEKKSSSSSSSSSKGIILVALVVGLFGGMLGGLLIGGGVGSGAGVTGLAIGGSGSTNYLAKWTSSSDLGNSIIYDNGNVGIGTTNPTKAKLQVQGNIYLGGAATDDTRMKYSSSHLYIENEGYAHPRVEIRPGGSATGALYPALTLSSSSASATPTYNPKVVLHTLGNSYFMGGNVGIGTPMPNQNYKLHVNSSGSTAIRVESTATTPLVWYSLKAQTEEWQLKLDGTDGNKLKILNGATTQKTDLTIDTLGKVGIGTTTPTQKLDVNGNISSSMMKGTGNDYVCVDSTGKLFRSNTAC